MHRNSSNIFVDFISLNLVKSHEKMTRMNISNPTPFPSLVKCKKASMPIN